MRAFAENLRQILLCPPLWFWHLLGALICVLGFVHPLQNRIAGQGHFVGGLVIPIWSAYVVASQQKEILLKPFVFALPGHRRCAVVTLLAVGAGTGVLASLTILAYPGLNRVETAVALWSAACLGFTLFSLIAAWTYWTSNTAAFSGLLIGSFYCVAHVTAVRTTIEKFALFHPILNGLLAVTAGFLLWRRLASTAFGRKVCGRSFLSLQSIWSLEKQRRFGLSRKIDSLRKRPGAGLPWLERISLAAMHRYPALSLRRTVAGSRYRMIGDLLPSPVISWAWALLFWMALITLAGYLKPREDHTNWSVVALVVLAPTILGSSLPLPTFSALLLPAGRRERYWATMAVTAIGGLLTIVLTLLIGLYLQIVQGIAPAVTLGGTTYPFHDLPYSLAYFSLVPLPFIYCSNLLFRRWAFVPNLILYIAFFLILLLATEPLSRIGLVGAAILIATSWSLLALVARTVCRHTDLVR